jgi:hypothetical protein
LDLSAISLKWTVGVAHWYIMPTVFDMQACDPVELRRKETSNGNKNNIKTRQIQKYHNYQLKITSHILAGYGGTCL